MRSSGILFVPTKTLFVDVLRKTFDSVYPIDQFRDLHVSIEFPVDRQHYPGVWVDFEPEGNLQRAGVGHVEYRESDTGVHRGTRWRFAGSVTLTGVALSSLERDLLVDEIIRVAAFGPERPETSRFSDQIENNDLIAVTLNLDEIPVTGFAASQGTPWDTDEIIYEATISIGMIGEFVSNLEGSSLVPLSQIVVYEYTDQEPDPFAGDEGGWI